MFRLSGRGALQQLASTGKYVFHGSQEGTIIQLEPIAGGSKRYNTTDKSVSVAEKYVYATIDFDVAIFVATIWRRVGASGWTTNGLYDTKNGFEFHASELAKEEAAKPESFGFVYVLEKSQFNPDTYNPYEMVSDSLVIPYALVRVTAFDLQPDFMTLTPPPSV